MISMGENVMPFLLIIGYYNSMNKHCFFLLGRAVQIETFDIFKEKERNVLIKNINFFNKKTSANQFIWFLIPYPAVALRHRATQIWLHHSSSDFHSKTLQSVLFQGHNKPFLICALSFTSLHICMYSRRTQKYLCPKCCLEVIWLHVDFSM